MPRFVLLDRDGVINRRIGGGYVTSWSDFVFLPAALEALRLLRANGYAAIILSNQACVAKGLITPSELQGITKRFLRVVEANGGRIEGVYYCLHREEDGCNCRKPKSGLLLRAQAEHRFAFADTFLIGDNETDLQAAREVGCPALLISEGSANRSEGRTGTTRGIFPSLWEAVQYILITDRVRTGSIPSP